ncbi:hypothetical protein CTAYLR_001404 [Chrysophaeum taylorii]|uniref:Uncharacterized protein n=1 Tax=Chrysophaeum taylorii TaxID=2483200 RepID=A0AAD7U9N8_9STRA|nr:hypothetical protein CTAYLR_001404 [Chrysophaeum taylorii]
MALETFKRALEEPARGVEASILQEETVIEGLRSLLVDAEGFSGANEATEFVSLVALESYMRLTREVTREIAEVAMERLIQGGDEAMWLACATCGNEAAAERDEEEEDEASRAPTMIASLVESGILTTDQLFALPELQAWLAARRFEGPVTDILGDPWFVEMIRFLGPRELPRSLKLPTLRPLLALEATNWNAVHTLKTDSCKGLELLLQRLGGLSSLDVSNSGATDASLAAALAVSPKTLTCLDATRNELTSASAIKILESFPNICRLRIGNNRDVDGRIIEHLSRRASRFETLSLRRCDLRNAGTFAVAKALGSRIKHLDLSYNFIECQGAARLADFLETNSSLASLALAFNSIQDKGAARLAHAMILNHTLAHLDVRHNNLTRSGISSLKHAEHRRRRPGRRRLRVTV